MATFVYNLLPSWISAETYFRGFRRKLEKSPSEGSLISILGMKASLKMSSPGTGLFPCLDLLPLLATLVSAGELFGMELVRSDGAPSGSIPRFRGLAPLCSTTSLRVESSLVAGDWLRT